MTHTTTLHKISHGYPATMATKVTTSEMMATKCGFFRCIRTFADGREVITFAVMNYGKLVALDEQTWKTLFATFGHVNKKWDVMIKTVRAYGIAI